MKKHGEYLENHKIIKNSKIICFIVSIKLLEYANYKTLFK